MSWLPDLVLLVGAFACAVMIIWAGKKRAQEREDDE